MEMLAISIISKGWSTLRNSQTNLASQCHMEVRYVIGVMRLVILRENVLMIMIDMGISVDLDLKI